MHDRILMIRTIVCAAALISVASCFAYEGKDFDFLIFTQRWPETSCYEWMRKNPSNTCRLPSGGEAWTVHGIWPTKNGTLGPFYCNNSMPFDIDKISNLVPKLNQFWTNIEKETPEDSLWKHEWEKHGTCASILAGLHSEDYYFGQGIAWFQSYAMGKLLEDAGIKPNDSVYVGQIHKGIFQALGKNPVIECYHDAREKKQLLTEIRICFDKDLRLRDCDGAVGLTGVEYASYKTLTKGTMITNCNPVQEVEYPSVVPNINSSPPEEKGFPFVKFYRIITFLRWFTF